MPKWQGILRIYVKKNISHGSKMFRSVDKIFDRTIKEVVIQHVYHYIYISVLMRSLKFKVSEGSKGSMPISNGVPPGYISISLPLLVRLKQWTNDYKVILAWKLLWSYLLTSGKIVFLFFNHKKTRDFYLNFKAICQYIVFEFLS